MGGAASISQSERLVRRKPADRGNSGKPALVNTQGSARVLPPVWASATNASGGPSPASESRGFPQRRWWSLGDLKVPESPLPKQQLPIPQPHPSPRPAARGPPVSFFDRSDTMEAQVDDPGPVSLLSEPAPTNGSHRLSHRTSVPPPDRLTLSTLESQDSISPFSVTPAAAMFPSKSIVAPRSSTSANVSPKK